MDSSVKRPKSAVDDSTPALGSFTSKPTQQTTHGGDSGVGFGFPATSTGAVTDTCPICLVTMKTGQGHAIFTGECSHAFHYHCIAPNLKSSAICPVCRAKWNQVPLLAPGQKSILSTPNVRTPVVLTPEPTTFNDDESLGSQTAVAGDTNQTRSLDITVHPEVSAVKKSDSKADFTVLIHLKAPSTSSQTSRAPVDLVTVLDVSGSMAGTKLALVKRAMEFVIQNLGPSDRLSVISFESTARRLFPLCKMTDSGKQRAMRAVNALVARGGTKIAEGLNKGAKVIEERREKNSVVSVILLSDGQDNIYSAKCTGRVDMELDYKALVPNSILQGRESGNQIPIHAFGFGSNHDAALMNSVSELSGGTFSFVEAEGMIQDAFAQCIGGILSVVLHDLRVGINCIDHDVHLGPLKAGSYSTIVMDDARSGFITVGDLYADEEKDFLVTINVPVGDISDETTLLNVHCVYRDLVSNEKISSEGKDVKIERPDIVNEVVVSLEVDRQKNRVQATEAMAAAQAEAEKGQFSNAVMTLENIRKFIAQSASTRAGDRLCVALDAELKDMQAKMGNRPMYETLGRAYSMSARSAHMSQRATARGDSTGVVPQVLCYQTQQQLQMLNCSRVYQGPGPMNSQIGTHLPSNQNHPAFPTIPSYQIPMQSQILQPLCNQTQKLMQQTSQMPLVIQSQMQASMVTQSQNIGDMSAQRMIGKSKRTDSVDELT